MARLKDISIAKKLYFIVGAMVILITAELLMLWFSIHTLSSVRAFIGAEGLWSKAQKDAIYQLGKYHRTHNEADYNAFTSLLAVPLGDHEARIELFKKDPDLQIVKQGLAKGRVHPDDMNGMINLVTKFSANKYISKAITYWGIGDSLIAILIPTAEEMHRQVSSGSPSPERLNELHLQIGRLNEQLTHVEDNFSFTLGEGARWLENLILKLLFSVALTVEITGLVLTVLSSRNITRGLNEINKAASRIKIGQLNARSVVLSKDEIGQVATSVNKMAEQLIVSNRELESFAYIASHDLQEPLRKIMVFTDILQQETGEGISDKGRQYMIKITESVARMQRLIDDVLQFAGVRPNVEFCKLNLNETLFRVVSDMEIKISKKQASITMDTLPEIEANPTQMQQLFQNLLGNALKFSETDPVIHISAEMIGSAQLSENHLQALRDKLAVANRENKIPEEFCRISVKDNGIGFDEAYRDQIFNAFQRLHSKNDYEGSGIGLAICQKITEYHHGMISAKSSAGDGATFIITLPLSQKDFTHLPA